MKRKPAPRRVRSTADDFTLLEYEGAKLRIYNNGMLTIKGSTKNAAFALAKQVMSEDGAPDSIEYNKCIRINCKKGKPYTIEWLGLGILQDDAYPEPKFWEEFKLEFERFCNLKAFI
jgi:hypothetical protein